MFILFSDYQEEDWKEFPVSDEVDFYYAMEVASAVVMDGVGYWIAYYDVYDSDTEDDEEERKVGVSVLSFDFVNEKFLEPFCALNVGGSWNLPVLCDRDGALSLVYMDPDRSCDIFVRKEDKWVLVDGIVLFPFVERCVWGRVEEDEEKEKKNMTVLATISNGLLMFDNADPEIIIASWDPLMSVIKDSNVVVANGLVESLLFPEV